MAHKESGVNWFGQVGGGRAIQPRPQVSAPALSQIPGLSKATGVGSYTDEPQRQFYRDTDSAYVRLAKQGGRTDLLRMDQDSATSEAKGTGYAIPSWMQQDSVTDDMHNAVQRLSCAQNTCSAPAMVSETRAAHTGNTLYKAWPRNSRATSPSHQSLRKKASMDIYKMPTLAETRLASTGKHHALEDTVNPGNYEGSHQLNTQPQTLADFETALPRTPTHSTLTKAYDQRQMLRDDEKPSSAVPYSRSEPISGTAAEGIDDQGSDVAQFYQSNAVKSRSDVERQRGDEIQDLELLQQFGSLSNVDTDMRNEADDAGMELHHQDTPAKDKDDLDFNDSASRADHWDSRQSSPPPLGDQNSGYSRYRRMSAEGDRQPMQSESQSAYVNKQSRDGESPANFRNDQFQQQQYSRQNISDAASEASRSSYQSPEQKLRDNARPDWLQWNPANNNRRDSASSGRQLEENGDSRGSAYGQRYQGNGSPQKPYATETSSAYSDKPFQSPGERRSSTSSNFPDEFYSKGTYPGSSQQKPSVTPNQQPAGVNRLKHSDSMSKIMSFGYLKDSDMGDSNQLTPSRSQPRLERDYVANTYTTEYKEKMHAGDASGANSIRSNNASIQSTGGYVPTPISDPGHRRRKQSMDDRPDFFKIGSNEPQSVPAYGLRKASAESRPDFFGAERVSSAAAVSYGKIKHDDGSKPDFFKIGSLDNYMERHVEEKKPDDGGILDKLNGYHGIPQKSNFRRRKMDINGPMLTMPVKAISRF